MIAGKLLRGLALVGLVVGYSVPAFAGLESLVPCAADPKRQQPAAEELRRLHAADQADYRKEIDEHPDRPFDEKKLVAMGINDLERRRRVADLFAAGCFQSAKDYASAALVFQHGNVSDHFLQAFVWARRAVELGDLSQKSVMALAIDRYLVSTGHKQLFASQFSKAAGGACMCLEPVEANFPDAIRNEYRPDALAESSRRLRAANGASGCPETYCRRELKPTPKGLALGFW